MIGRILKSSSVRMKYEAIASSIEMKTAKYAHGRLRTKPVAATKRRIDAMSHRVSSTARVESISDVLVFSMNATPLTPKTPKSTQANTFSHLGWNGCHINPLAILSPNLLTKVFYRDSPSGNLTGGKRVR